MTLAAKFDILQEGFDKEIFSKAEFKFLLENFDRWGTGDDLMDSIKQIIELCDELANILPMEAIACELP